ncbi:MAG TPA: glycerophosphodiester phosphodiesterase [Gemmatimonadales bacterium]|nr:glycerophosphodiester phosphodiesterase [Gemmatimonadales bacterium]
MGPVALLLDPAARPIIGHRGAAAYAPENTMASFRLALELGVDALEFDVRVTRDGEAVVLHDPTLERTTNALGPLRLRSLNELEQVDAGFQFSPDGRDYPWRGKGLRIPRLRQVIEEFPTVPLLIEVKEPEAQEAIARVLRETGAADRAVLAGSDWRSLQAFRSPPFHLGASRRDIARLYFRWGEPDPACRCFAVPDRFKFLPVPTRRFVRAAHDRRASVHVWTVDDPTLARRLWANGVNGMVTNRPDLIVKERER